MKKIEYVIYCRKSSDESSENQKQSIPDQIQKCLEYAEREWLSIKLKPADFSEFETEEELRKEDNEADLMNRNIYLKSRHYFIVKEEKTAKIPGARRKWAALIKLVKAKKINGIISYSPDRQARNMIEWGEIIDLVDQNKLKVNRLKGITILNLKYTNFHFEDNAAGKMMLWIWFVFSKQYSDKLWEDIARWNESKVKAGKAIGRHKPWYRINKEGFHEPHPQYYDLIKEAFEMKLNNVAETKIKQFLDANGYVRKMRKTWEEKLIWINTLNNIFKDEFYYGIFINGEAHVDQRKHNPYYIPMITEDQFQIIMDRYRANPLINSKSIVKDEYDEIRSFENDFILTEDNFHLTLSLPNPKRHKDKIVKANLKWIKISFKDVVTPKQIVYRCANKNSKFYNLSITHEEINTEIMNKLSYFKVTEEAYTLFKEFCDQKLDTIILKRKESLTSKNLELWRLRAKKDEYIKKHYGIKKDVDEERIYQNEKNEFERKIEILKKEVDEVESIERNEIFELEVFIEVLNKAKEYYKKANYVQKWKIAKILFSNIVLNHEKRLLIQPKAGLETLFTHHWWS